MTIELDPIKYEIFRHRLWRILEEGRIAMKMVSGSAVVVEGGETLSCFYDSKGMPILSASGILLHLTGARDFIVKCIEWYEQDPGIHEGDQFFFNDYYIGGQHLADEIVIKPIFYQGQRIAWTSAFMHTPETGGIEPGGMPVSATEIFHEGPRFLGLKIVEAGKFRPEVFKTITDNTRDPLLVGLDVKARIASCNVCAKKYLELIDAYGLEFVQTASQRIIEDAEKEARAFLRKLPNGIWRARQYADTTGFNSKPFKVQCTMSKQDDEITFDFTGSSPQNTDSNNSTLPATWGSLFVTLASQLFGEIPWNGGMIAPVQLIAEPGSVVNPHFPAAGCQAPPTVGEMITATSHECVAKMFFAAGLYERVNSGWSGGNGSFPHMGGINAYGDSFGAQILDVFSSGCGAAPYRDGVDTGANMMNPASNISDCEILEQNLPIMYLQRMNGPDSAGFGKYDGGMGPEHLYMIYGSDKVHVGNAGIGKRAPAGFGMFGGYSTGLQEAIYMKNSNIREWFAQSRVPVTYEDVLELTGDMLSAPAAMGVLPCKSFDIIKTRHAGGGGYGDPLERDVAKVAEDVRLHAISLETAKEAYGVIIDARTREVDGPATEKERARIIQERLTKGRKLR